MTSLAMIWRLERLQAGEPKKLVYLAAAASLTAATAGFAIFQLTKILFSVVRDSEYEAGKLIASVTAHINSDSPDLEVPEELTLYDDLEDIYTYGSLQELFYRRSNGGETDWEWSFDQDEWYSTAELAPDHSFILDPPSLIFIARLHLMSVARRKVAAAGGAGSSSSGTRANNSRQHSRIPPAVELPAWAQQQLQHHRHLAAGTAAAAGTSSSAAMPAGNNSRCSSDKAGGWLSSSSGSSWRGGDAACCSSSSSSGFANGRQRRIEDAPDLLCCPITGQIMLQPVSLPSGRTFEYEAVRRWITQHGTDPVSGVTVSLLDLHANLIVREMVEKWLAGTDPLADEAITAAAVEEGSDTSDEDEAFSEEQHGELDHEVDDGSSSSSGGNGSGGQQGWQQQRHQRRQQGKQQRRQQVESRTQCPT